MQLFLCPIIDKDNGHVRDACGWRGLRLVPHVLSPVSMTILMLFQPDTIPGDSSVLAQWP